jgi:glycosyltransferase involved in cell wall biosynthesis
MNNQTELSIVIPAYNEAENLKIILPDLVEFVRKNNWHLIITNDGSKDNTKEILESYKDSSVLTIVNHKLNKGYGAAIKSGIEACNTEYLITIDADGQHQKEDVEKLFHLIKKTDADMIVGSRKGNKDATIARGIGKSIIRFIANLLLKIPIYDINSGMKIYRAELAKQYLYLTPNSMPFSDVITLIFISNRNLVLEEPISIKARLKGESTIGIQTAFETVKEIINIIFLFNPLKIFLPISILIFLLSIAWGIPIILKGQGVSVGAVLGILSSLIFFFLGLIAEQLTLIRKNKK